MSGTLLHSLNAVGVILILTACGYVCSALGWITPGAKTFLSRYLMRLAVPVMCVYSLRSNLSLEMLKSFWQMVLIPVICMTVLFLLSGLTAKLLRLDPKRASVFRIMCGVSNAMFIGYSMCRELFGEDCAPYVMTFYLVNTSFAQLVGVSGIRRTGGHGGGTLRSAAAAFFKTPSVLGVLVGLLLIVTDLQLPAVIMSSAKYVNNTVTPLALLMAGSVIHEIGLKHLHLDRLQLLVLAFRFLISPGLCVLLCAALGVTGLARSAMVVMSAMPVLTQAVVASAEYGGDEQLAAQGVAVSTLACFVVIPVLMLLL